MAEKKYYWLKLKSDFFDDETIKFIEEQENGIKYSNFYLKLCLKSLKTEGILIRLIGETLIPYDINSLSKLTLVDADTIRCAMDLFEKIGLVKILDGGEIYLSQINEMIGKETDKAQIMRRKRAKNKGLQEHGNIVTKMLPKCYTEIEIEKEKDIEIDNTLSEVKTSPSDDIKHKYGEYRHVLLKDKELDALKKDYANWEALIKYLDEYIEMKGYKAKSHYLCIKKWVVDAVKKQGKSQELDYFGKPIKQKLEDKSNQYENLSKFYMN